MEQTRFGAESSKWPDTRQNWAITTPPAAGMQVPTPSAPPSGWPPLNSTSLPGLESLMHLDRIFIDQRIEPWEVVSGFNTKNKYIMMDVDGHHLFDLQEDSSLFSRLCCGSAREFEIKVFDTATKREVLRLYRPMEFCLGQLEIYSGEKRLGSIYEKCALRPEFDIRDECGNMVFQIGGPLCHCDCLGYRKFKIFSADASRQIGVITKEWSGLARELFTTADVFGISFPGPLDVQLKALLIGAAILIDFAYYEQRGGLLS